MLKKNGFKKPQNTLEGHDKLKLVPSAQQAEEMCVNCPSCKKILSTSELSENFHVCGYCGHHFRTNARQRLSYICDTGSFVETDGELSSHNPIGFPNYEAKLKSAKLDSAEKEAVVCGTCTICGYPTAIFVMEPYFMMGSMGSVVGEKITRLFEFAEKENLPVIGFTVSGGARMQEGILSLMQMAKTSGAVKRHSDAGNLYLAVLTDPTTGGVTASFAMEADIIVAEPRALVGFAGPRVIEQTLRKKIPDGFQRAEFLMEKGFLDDIVDRRRQRKYLSKILSFHAKEAVK